MMIDPSGHVDHAVLFLAIVGGFHAVIVFLKVVRFFATELREELVEWRKFFRGG